MTQETERTKEQLIIELSKLKRRFGELEKERQKSQQLANYLQERTKELACMYSIAQIVDDPNIPLNEIFQQVADELPLGFQYPQDSVIKISIDDCKYTTINYQETDWELSADIVIDGNIRGKIEVFYLEQKPESHIGPFLSEELLLISIVAGRLGRLIERKAR